MGDVNDKQRIGRFVDMYAKIVRRPLNPAELESDDMYAFQAFERAQRAGHQELRELALDLQARRQARMESRAAAARLSGTYRMPTLARAQPPGPVTPDPGNAVADLDFTVLAEADNSADLAAALGALIPAPPAPASEAAPASVAAAAEPATSAETAPPRAERRSGAMRLDPRELAMVASLLRLYREHFGAPLDVARFFMDDAYGRAVIEESRGASHPALAELAGGYLDQNGLPLRHRRGSGTAPRSESKIMDNRTVNLACDGTLQALGDFHGIATDCVVRNEVFGSPVAVSAKGFLQALLAPGHAIAYRSSAIRVQGPPGSVVALDFVGVPDLTAEA